MIHFEETGTGQALLCLHGAAPGATGLSNFGTNMEGFGQNFRTLVADLPGHGRSDELPAGDGEGYQRLAAHFHEELLKAGITKTHIVGMATGGAVAITLAAFYPEMVDKLVLVGPPGGQSLFSPSPAEGIKAIRGYYKGSGPSREKMRSYVELTVKNPALITDEIVEERYQASLVGYDAATGTVTGAEGTSSAPILGYLKDIQAETLVVWGMNNRIQGVENAFQFLKGIPRAELHVYDDAGLWVPFEKRPEFESLVTSFLTR